MGIILRVFRLEVSLYNVCITNQFQTTFAQGGAGGGGVERVKSVRRGDIEYQGGKKNLKTFGTFVPITSKNSASVEVIPFKPGYF